MKNKKSVVLALFVIVAASAAVASAQKAKLGKVCGDPIATCKNGESFQSYELPFENVSGNKVMYESKYFYAIILKSANVKNGCSEDAYPDSEISEVQSMFAHNKVFAYRCDSPAQNYYTGVKNGTVFLAVYAGDTLAAANKFLKTVKETGKFPGVKARKMQAGINGT